MENTTINEGKTAAIISYLWIPGLIIAFVMNNEKKNPFTSFHIRQMIGLMLLNIVAIFLSRYINNIAGWTVDVIAFVLWIMGFIAALQGEEKKVPFLGEQFQEWFKQIG